MSIYSKRFADFLATEEFMSALTGQLKRNVTFVHPKTIVELQSFDIHEDIADQAQIVRVILRVKPAFDGAFS